MSSTRQGYLWKRMASSGGVSPPAVQRVYCVLAGTTLWDYDSEEEAALGLRPRSEVDVIGVSPWDGRARYQNYSFGFLFLSSLGTTYHAVAQSKEDLEYWLSAMRVGLQAKFGIVAASAPGLDEEEEGGEDDDEEEEEEEEGEGVGEGEGQEEKAEDRQEEPARREKEFTPRSVNRSSGSSTNGHGSDNVKRRASSLSTLHSPGGPGGKGTSSVLPTNKVCSPPSKRDSELCGISGQALGRSNPKQFCLSCGGAFGQEYCCEDVPLLHFKFQQGVRVCRNCFLAQYFLNHLKLLNATLRTYLHELEVEGKAVTDKSSAKIRVFRHPSKEVFLAWQLYESNQIDAAEFTELLKADARLKDERENNLLAEFHLALTQSGVGQDAITLLRFLFELRDEGQPLKYALILQQLLVIAESDLAAVDFILPQLLQIYILMSDRGGLPQVLQLEALEDFIVKICSMSAAQIPLRVVWSMMGYYEDTLQLNAPASLLARRGRIIRLTLHVEAAVRGNVHEMNEEILNIFSISSPAQLELLRHEWALVQECRQHPLLRPFPPMTAFRKMHGEIGDDPKTVSAIAESLREYDKAYSLSAAVGGGSGSGGGAGGRIGGKGRMGGLFAAGGARQESGGGGMEDALISFATQMKFVKELTDAAESLRHIDPSLRRETLRATLQRIQNEYRGVYFPITRDFGTMPKILRVCVDEGAVFRSKARVPILICFEVIRPSTPVGNMDMMSTPHSTHTTSTSVLSDGRISCSSSSTTSTDTTGKSTGTGTHHQRASSGSVSATAYMSEQEAEHLLDKGALHERMNSLEMSEGRMPPMPQMQSGGLAVPVAVQPHGEERRRTSSLTRPDLAAVGEEASPGGACAGVAAGVVSGSPNVSISRTSSGNNSSLTGNTLNRYASKSEVLQMVLTRRRKTGSLRGDTTSPRDEEEGEELAKGGGTPGRPVSSSFSAAAAALDVAQLIRRYEQTLSLGGEEATAKLVSPAVATAIEEYKRGNLSKAELEMLVANDQRFQQNIQENSYLDEQFFVSMAFGESWASKRARIKAASSDGDRPGWDLLSMIVKSNDDLRQELCVVQLVELCRDIFLEAGLELWLEPYGIISTTSSTGLIETLTDALSLDALKKKDGYVSLAHHFDASYGHDKARLAQAKRAFITSLAAYSLVCYIFQIKDRHNGNILLDTEGHLVHIDYGFILGIAPGGSFSIETAPFKLTPEMVEVMGGVDSPLFDEFAALFACGYFALQLNMERIVALVEIMAEQSRYPCFQATDKVVILQKLRARMLPGGKSPNNPNNSKSETVAFALDLITQSYNSLTTSRYDQFQSMVQNIAV